MNPTFRSFRTLVLALATLAMPAFAGGPSQPPLASPAESAEGATPVPESAETSVALRNCLRETGTRIRSEDPQRCAIAPGSVYDRHDIDRTGDTDVGSALQRLSPSIRIQ